MQLPFNPEHRSIIISSSACVHSIQKGHYMPQMLKLTQTAQYIKEKFKKIKIKKKIKLALHLLPVFPTHLVQFQSNVDS